MKIGSNIYLIVIKLRRNIFNKTVLHLHFEYLQNWRKFIFFKFGRLFEPFFVFSLKEYIKVCYDKNDKKISHEHKLLPQTDTSE